MFVRMYLKSTIVYHISWRNIIFGRNHYIVTNTFYWRFLSMKPTYFLKINNIQWNISRLICKKNIKE